MLLIIHKDPRDGAALADMFRYMNILSFAVTPAEALSELTPLVGAVLIADPSAMPDAAAFIGHIREKTDAPVFALEREALPVSVSCLLCGTFSYDVMSSTVAKNIVAFAVDHGKKPIGDYRALGVDASSDLAEPTYCGEPLGLTRTETRLLSLLLLAYPAAVRTADLLRYGFSPAKMPTSSDVRTLLCAVNRKFRQKTGGTLITGADGGYVLCTPKVPVFT